ncbi:MAG: DMT family transporter [Candidatus Gagatemarchaeaceae archaeon]
MQNLKGYALLVLLGVIWGNAFVAIRVAVSPGELTPVSLTLLRWLIVSAAFLALYPLIGKAKARFERKDFFRLLVVSLTSVAIYHLSLNFSEQTVNASLAGLLISLSPLFSVVLSALALHEKIGIRVKAGLVVAIAGAAVISSPDVSLGSTNAFGPLLVVVSALSSAVFTVASKPLVSKYGPFPVAVWSAVLGTAVLLPLIPVFSPNIVQEAVNLNLQGWTAVLYLSLLSTVVANLIFYTLVGRQMVSRLVVQLYIVPLVSVVGGVLILGEQLGLATVVGGAMLLVAVGLATISRH